MNMKRILLGILLTLAALQHVNAQDVDKAYKADTAVVGSFWNGWFVQAGLDMTLQFPYGKNLAQAVETGTYLAASVITSLENVCPRFQPAELGLSY